MHKLQAATTLLPQAFNNSHLTDTLRPLRCMALDLMLHEPGGLGGRRTYTYRGLYGEQRERSSDTGPLVVSCSDAVGWGVG